MGTIDNFTNSGYHGICFKPRTLYVIFSPLMYKPSRGFLAENIEGIVEVFIFIIGKIFNHKN